MSRRYVFRDGRWRDPTTHEPMHIPKRDGVCSPMAIIADIPAHRAPSGAYISGRKAMMDDCRAHGYVPYEPVGDNRPTGITDAKFAKAYGLKTCEKTQDWLKTQREKHLAPAAINALPSK